MGMERTISRCCRRWAWPRSPRDREAGDCKSGFREGTSIGNRGPLVGNGGARIRSPASSSLPCERARQARTAAGLKLNHDVEQRAEALFHFVFGPDDSASGIEEFDQVRVAATAFVQVAESRGFPGNEAGNITGGSLARPS
jgi:hypothetical protein